MLGKVPHETSPFPDRQIYLSPFLKLCEGNTLLPKKDLTLKAFGSLHIFQQKFLSIFLQHENQGQINEDFRLRSHII